MEAGRTDASWSIGKKKEACLNAESSRRFSSNEENLVGKIRLLPCSRGTHLPTLEWVKIERNSGVGRKQETNMTV